MLPAFYVTDCIENCMYGKKKVTVVPFGLQRYLVIKKEKAWIFPPPPPPFRQRRCVRQAWCCCVARSRPGPTWTTRRLSGKPSGTSATTTPTRVRRRRRPRGQTALGVEEGKNRGKDSVGVGPGGCSPHQIKGYGGLIPQRPPPDHKAS